MEIGPNNERIIHPIQAVLSLCACDLLSCTRKCSSTYPCSPLTVAARLCREPLNYAALMVLDLIDRFSTLPLKRGNVCLYSRHADAKLLCAVLQRPFEIGNANPQATVFQSSQN
jgi:hypothetical protein